LTQKSWESTAPFGSSTDKMATLPEKSLGEYESKWRLNSQESGHFFDYRIHGQLLKIDLPSGYLA
jgi:hypothetical protein